MMKLATNIFEKKSKQVTFVDIVGDDIKVSVILCPSHEYENIGMAQSANNGI